MILIRKRGILRVGLLAVMAAVGGDCAWVSGAEVFGANGVEQVAQQELEPLGAVLNDASATGAQREEAARRLVMKQSAGARQILATVLGDTNNPRGQIAVAKALAMDPNPDANFIQPLHLLLGMDKYMTEAAAQALANYKENSEAFRFLSGFANSRQQREVLRISAIKAIGTLAEKRAAEMLISLLTREDESEKIRNSAADALRDMTGLNENGHDVQKWLNWWAQNAKKNDAEWKGDLLARQAARYSQMQLLNEQLVEELQAVLTDQYQTAVESRQPEILLKYLKSTNAEVRTLGAQIVHDDALAARRVPISAKEYLRTMVGDSSAEVRLAVVGALHAINDAGALDSLLAQAAQETNPDVKAGLAIAMASIGDLKAVAPLRGMLHDASVATATAAASGFKDLGVVIRAKNPALATEIAGELKNVLEMNTAGPGTLPLREAVVEAMVPLREPSLLNTFYRLLREGGSTRIRWAALKALGELREPKAADTIARYLEDKEDGVRLEAVRALGRAGAAEHAEELFKRLNPAEEPDGSVREQAWVVMQGLFGEMPAEQLHGWADRFRNEPGRRVVVLQALAGKYEKEKKGEELAYARQNIGAALMAMGQHAEAAAYFKQALVYWQERKVDDMVTEQLIEQYLVGLLRSRQYGEAAAFGEKLISNKVMYQQTVGANIRAEAERLRNEEDLQGALQLIEEAKKMSKPPLAAQYRDDLGEIEKEVRGKLQGSGK